MRSLYQSTRSVGLVLVVAMIFGTSSANLWAQPAQSDCEEAGHDDEMTVDPGSRPSPRSQEKDRNRTAHYPFYKLIGLSNSENYKTLLIEYDRLVKSNIEIPTCARRVIADAALVVGKLHRAIKLYRWVIAAQPDDLSIRLSLIEALQQDNAYIAAIVESDAAQVLARQRSVTDSQGPSQLEVDLAAAILRLNAGWQQNDQERQGAFFTIRQSLNLRQTRFGSVDFVA